MIEYVSGKLVQKSPTHVVLETGGLGYFIHISLNTFSKIPETNACTLFTHVSIKEDAHTLYGFFEEEERVLFRHLISVSGIGTTTARMILSAYSPHEIQQAIILGNAPLLQGIKGIGAKSAMRVIIDLKDKLGKDNLGSFLPSSDNTIRQEALSALVSLGFVKQNVEKAIEKVMRQSTTDMTLEALIKLTLKEL